MKIGTQLYNQTQSFGIQIGNKLDLAYDSGEPNHITQLIEKKYFPQYKLKEKFIKEDYDYFKNNLKSIENESITSPFSHIGTMRVVHDIEPFDGLIFRESVGLAEKFINVREIITNTFIFENL